MNYKDDMPKINIRSFYENELDLIIDLFCTQSINWEYEKKWRCIHQNVQRYTYEAEALKAVYFGPDIERESLEIICLILSGQNPNVELWQGHRSKAKFKVEFEEVTYTSFIEAQKKGLF